MKLPRWLDWLPFGHVPEINPNQLPCDPLEVSDHFQLIDVRSHTEWQQSHIQGSINLPLQRFSLSAPELNSEHKPIICICLSAHRSTPAVRKLRRAGIEAYELKGGMLNWWRLKLPTEKN